MELEHRAFTVTDLCVEMREADGRGDQDGRSPGYVISGYAAVFDSESLDLGGFVEVVERGAFGNLNGRDIRSLWNHNADYPLGRSRANTLVVREDERGLWFELMPPDTSYARDLIVSMQRGDVDQMSFGFRTTRDRWETLEDGRERRTLLAVELREVSPVTFPAYLETSAMVEEVRRFATAGAADDAGDVGEDADGAGWQVRLGWMLRELELMSV